MKTDCVLFYKWGTATLEVPFPNGDDTCHFCPYLRNDEGCRRNYCALTREYLMFPFTGRGLNCPVEFENKEESKTWEEV